METTTHSHAGYDEVGRSTTYQAKIWTKDHATRYIFDDGHMVSLLWGKGSYGSMNELGQAIDYEVAVFKPNGDYLTLTEWDDVIGHRTWYEVKHILEKVNTNNAKDLELSY